MNRKLRLITKSFQEFPQLISLTYLIEEQNSRMVQLIHHPISFLDQLRYVIIRYLLVVTS